MHLNVSFIYQFTRIFTALAFLILTIGCQTQGSLDSDVKDQVIDTKIQIAKSQINRGSPEEAIQTLEPILSQYPKNPKVIQMLAMSHLSLQNNKKAVELLRRAYNLEPSIAAGLNLSAGLIASKEFHRAENVLRALLNKNELKYRQLERLHHNLGYVLEQKKKIKPAIYSYKKALEVNPRFYLSNIQLAKIYKKMRRHNQSLKYLVKATSSCAVCYEATHMLATEYINRNQLDDAQKVLRAFLKTKKAQEEDKKSAESLLQFAEKKAPTKNKKISRKRGPREYKQNQKKF